MTVRGARRPPPALFYSGLQPKRTALAWRRTALAIVAAALLSGRILPELLGSWAAGATAAAAAVGLALFIAANARHRMVCRTPLHHNPDRTGLPGGALLLAVTGLVLCGGVAAFSAVIAAFLQ